MLLYSAMSRSVAKGPFVDPRILKKVAGKRAENTPPIKIWVRDCVISPEMVGFKFLVHNGKDFPEVLVSEEMVGHRFGEFSLTRKFVKHGGKIQKEAEAKAKEAEVASAQAAKAAVEAKK